MASTSSAAGFEPSLWKALAQELIRIWIASPPGTNLQAIAQSINRLNTLEGRPGSGSRASATNAQRLKDFDVSNLEVICDAKLGTPTMIDRAAVVSLFDHIVRKSYEFNREDPPLINTSRRSNYFNLRSMKPIDGLVGRCVIAVWFKGHTCISGSALRTVVDYLFQKCSLSPSVPMGARGVRHSRNGGKKARKRGLYNSIWLILPW